MDTLPLFFIGHLYTTENNQRLKTYQSFIDEHIPNCVQAFYDTLLSIPTTKRFLTTHLIENHLKKELSAWIKQTLSPKNSETDIQLLVNKQRQVGQVHSRIAVPMPLVNSAMSTIKQVMFTNIRNRVEVPIEEKADLIILLNLLLDSALSLINESFLEEQVNTERHAQEFRSRSSAHEIAIEIERVRGALFGWMTQFMSDLLTLSNHRKGDIHHQEFSLWIRHKLGFVCTDQRVTQKITHNLDELQQALNELHHAPLAPKEATIQKINALTNECGWMLGQIADKNIEDATREDALTSLIERRFMAPILQSETQLAIKTQEPYTLLMIDVDNFKSVNDIHGHPAGDAVLSSIGRQLKRSLRVTDYAFRYGGEEFIILMPETTLNNALLAAQKLLENIRQIEVKLDNGRTLKVTVSIGLAQFAQDPDYQQLIKIADEKLYEAKHGGKDRYAF